MQRPATFFWTFAVICCALILSACGGRGGSVPYDVANFGLPDAPVVMPSSDDYRIGPSDVLTINVFGVPEYSGDFTVDDSGRIQVPLIGNVPMTGRTSDQAAADITRALDKTYLKSPKVQVQVKTAVSRRVTIDGAVTAPGVYPIGSQATLLQAVAMARGTTENANPRRTVIFRTIDGKRMAAAFDLVDIRRGTGKDPDIYANDIIVVDGSQVKKNLQTALSTIPVLGLFAQFGF